MAAPAIALISPAWEGPRLIEVGRTVGLGSGPQAEVTVPGADPLHCRIEWPDGAPLLVACGPTTCNGEPVERRALADGDEFGLGGAPPIRVRTAPGEIEAGPRLCRECREPLSAEEAAGGGRYRIGELVLCRRCVWAGSGAFPQIAGLRLVHRIGGGMAGQVFEAHDWKSGRRMALKLLPIARGRDAARARYRFERLQRELELARKLRHPGILRLFRIGQQDGQVYLVMEYVQGTDWQRLLDRRGRPYDLTELQQPLARVAEALDHAHAQQVVHRDIKPGNILIGERGLVKIADFGLARQAQGPSQLTKTGTLLGTVPFASPEQLADPAGADPRSDVYSLAATIYCLLAGEPPFVNKNHFKLLREIREDPAPLLAARRPDLPRALGETLARALSKAPALRPASAGELVAAILR